MKYINTRTGAIIDSPCTISGGNWIVYGEKPTAKKEVVETVEEKTIPVAEEDTDGPTKADIMKELDAMGIEYNKKAKKEDLLNLMKGE